MSRRLLAFAASVTMLVGCAPAEGRHLDADQLTELEQIVDGTTELVHQTERELAADPQ